MDSIPTRGGSLHGRLLVLLAGMATWMAGCAEPTIRPSLSLLPPGRPQTYTDGDWAEVLVKHVREGLIDYDGLLMNREPLERYYALLSETGPTRTPDQFASRSAVTAYWINAYNALVLRAAMERYPVRTMYDLALPRLEFDYTFRVDGKIHNLAAIEARMLEDSAQDARTLLATSRAAVGTPRLMSEPYRADTLESQLTQAAADALDNPNLLRIDHATKTILVWQIVLNHESDFLAYWRVRRRVSSIYLYNVLLDMASPARRRTLQSAVGYRLREIPFERRINAWTRSTQQTVP
ncbi:MAG TPA: DUF547 domain-containing protein [Phycisphaerae bacterium]|nr:DUF547 domain-containing protein [Phycisphaerae bacterium]